MEHRNHFGQKTPKLEFNMTFSLKIFKKSKSTLRAANSLNLLADVTVIRNATFLDNIASEQQAKGSNGAHIRHVKTWQRDHCGTMLRTEGETLTRLLRKHQTKKSLQSSHDVLK